MTPTVTDEPAASRYELRVDGELTGVLTYRPDPERASVLILPHTEVTGHEGAGLGSTLVRETLDDLRARGLTIVPLCPFVADFLRRHPDYGDLVA